MSLYLFARLRRLPKDISAGVTEAIQATTGAIGDMNRSLGEIKTRGERLEEFGKAINEIGSLLKPPQMRGMTGEVLLEKMLSDMLPHGNYQMKYSFRSGDQVDAVIKFREFVQAVKKQVDNIAKKYIMPNEKTFEFALMYVPSESVYYEAIVRDKQFGEETSLLSYATKNRVYIVSPSTLYPYISTIIHGLKAFRIEENAKQILERIGGLRKDFEDFKNVFDIIGGHLSDAYKKYISEAARRLVKVETDLSSLELRQKDESEPEKILEERAKVLSEAKGTPLR